MKVNCIDKCIEENKIEFKFIFKLFFLNGLGKKYLFLVGNERKVV